MEDVKEEEGEQPAPEEEKEEEVSKERAPA